MNQPTVVIADDHVLIRQGIQKIVEFSGLHVVAEASDGLQAIALVRKNLPDLLVLDIAMPYARGIEVFGEVKRWSPRTKTIVFSGMTSASLISELAESGAHGIFLKHEDLNAFTDAIPQILSGQRVLGPGVLDMIQSNHVSAKLTVRERQVLSLVLQGLNNRVIADRLGVSAKTADHHRTNLMRKLGIHSAAELLAFAVREGLLETSKET